MELTLLGFIEGASPQCHEIVLVQECGRKAVHEHLNSHQGPLGGYCLLASLWLLTRGAALLLWLLLLIQMACETRAPALQKRVEKSIMSCMLLAMMHNPSW